MSTTSVSPASFTGSSSFSDDLAQVVSRAVSFASLPMQQLQNEQSTLQNQQTALQSLSSQFQSLESAVDGINSAVGSGSFAATVSNSAVVSASTSAGVMAGSYSLTVLNTGSQTSTLSDDGLTTVANPATGNIDSSSTYTLTVNSQTYNISDSSNSLTGLAQAINASGANVQATVVNVGSSSAPDYRLSVQSTEYSPDTIQLSDGTNNLLNTVSTGSSVQYQVGGSTSTVTSNSRSVTLSTGLSVNLISTGTANITVAENSSGIENALSSFVSAYNSAVDELAKSRGQNGGALAGESYIDTLTSDLQNLSGYDAGSGSVQSLADLGVTFDDNGHLQFDSSTFEQASNTSLNDVQNFLGSETTSGFLQNAETLL